MGKIKVRELASKNSIPTDELLRALKDAGFRVSSAASVVDEAKARPFLPPRAEASPAPANIVRIKKYENRRLYSTTHSRHLTLDELAHLVRSGHSIEVTDAGNGRDLTSEMLMQILIEEGRAVEMPSLLLTQMVRLQDEAMKGEMSRWLGTLFELYTSPMRMFSGLMSHWGRTTNVEQKLYSEPRVANAKRKKRRLAKANS